MEAVYLQSLVDVTMSGTVKLTDVKAKFNGGFFP